MPNPDLEKYITTSREQKIPDETIKDQLIKSGWGANDVADALAPKTEAATLPPPPVPRLGMWVAFHYIILFITLYMSATAIGGILHIAVNNTFKDNLDLSNSYSNSFDTLILRGFLAALIVGFPIFATLFVMAKKQLAEKPVVRNLGVRKLLIYITLFGTFLLMIWNLFLEIYRLLGGETTSRSLAHLAVTFLVAGSIFAYLLLEVREDRRT
ncbi:MAG: DUF5671 domain-containing protein [bacterium]|nr:DUF5671 domain-containing protein [bacterium]